MGEKVWVDCLLEIPSQSGGWFVVLTIRKALGSSDGRGGGITRSEAGVCR